MILAMRALVLTHEWIIFTDYNFPEEQDFHIFISFIVRLCIQE